MEKLALKCQKVRNLVRLSDCEEGMPNVRSGVFRRSLLSCCFETPVNLTEYQRKLLKSLMNLLTRIKKGIIRTAKLDGQS